MNTDYRIKVVILAYDFQPKANTAAQRPNAWFNYMPEMGIYPIVITKRWSSDDQSHEKTDDYEIHRLDSKYTLQEKYWIAKTGIAKVKRKISTIANYFLHTSPTFGPYGEFYDKALNVLKSTEGKKIIIATGMPFGMFGVGYRLNKELGIPWVMDYRDDWTTSELPRRKLKKLSDILIDKHLEKKWLRTVLFFTSVSDHYVNKIGALVKGSVGYTIENGYFEEEHSEIVKVAKQEILSFVYVGSLYRSQNIDEIIDCISSVSLEQKVSCKFYFLGTPLTEAQKNRLKLAEHKYFQIIVTERMPKQKALELQLSCQYAVMAPHKGLKGVPSSKLYEFIGARQPVLVHPDDRDIIHHNLSSAGLGIFSDDKSSLQKNLANILNQNMELRSNDEQCEVFTRRNQTKRLVDIIKQSI